MLKSAYRAYSNSSFRRCPECVPCDKSDTRSKSLEKMTDNTSKPKISKMTCYHASWCGHCKMFLPEWLQFENISKNMFKNVKISNIQCDSTNGESECAKNGIEGYPTVLVYFTDNSVMPYTGNRTKEDLIEYMKNNL